MRITNGELLRRFDYHPPQTEQKVNDHQQVRQTMLNAAQIVVEVTGAPSREQSMAITKLEEAMFWANAALARPQPE